MQKAKALKCGLIVTLIVLASLASLMYALAYTINKEVLYTETFKIEGQTQTYKTFYLSAPATTFEVKLTVSEGTIKWTPYSAELFEATFGSLQPQLEEAAYSGIQGWECETGNGIVKWRIGPENLNQVWYLNFFNEDSCEKEVNIKVTKVWSGQNYQDWF